MKIDDGNFIKYLKKRDEKALDFLIDNYGALIKSIVRKHLYNLEFIQDECINDILLAVWDGIERFNYKENSFKNWLAAICKYKCIDYKRKYLKTLLQENIDDMQISVDVEIDKNILKKELDSEIENLLESLTYADKTLFVNLYIEEIPIEEVSQNLGVSKAVIYNRVSRGRKKLRELFSR